MKTKLEKMKDSMVKAGVYSPEDIEEIYRLEKQFAEECEQIALDCAEEGYPAYGANYELRRESARRYYDEQISYITEKYIKKNTIILLHGTASLTDSEYKEFDKGDTIWACPVEPEEIGRWNISDEAAAKEELTKYRCSYYHRNHNCWDIEEYALEYCRCDKDGEFLDGSDFDLAEEVKYS